MIPKSKDWKIWKGGEIEGSKDLGVQTLFIRELKVDEKADLSFLPAKSKCKRVWFCKEFTDWKLLKRIAALFETVCIEVEPKNLESIPIEFRKKYNIYLKVILNYDLKPGDFVCVGKPYEDEAFAIGSGNKVKPEQYGKDIRIV